MPISVRWLAGEQAVSVRWRSCRITSQSVQSDRDRRRYYIADQQGENADAYHVGAPNYGLTKDSIILTEQIRTLDKRRLREKMGSLDEKAMRHVDEALAVSFGLGSVQG